MTDSGLAAELDQSLEIILAGTLCERGNSSQNTAPRASTRLAAPRRGHAFEGQSAQKRYEADCSTVAVITALVEASIDDCIHRVHFDSQVTASASIDPHQGGTSVLCSYRTPSTREVADVTFLCTLVRVLEPNGRRPPLEPAAAPPQRCLVHVKSSPRRDGACRGWRGVASTKCIRGFRVARVQRNMDGGWETAGHRSRQRSPRLGCGLQRIADALRDLPSGAGLPRGGRRIQ